MLKRGTLFIILGIFTGLIAFGVVGAFFYKKSLSRYAINSYLIAKGIDMDFDVEHFSLSEITLTNIVLEEKIKISRLRLLMDDGIGMPTTVEAKVENLDIGAFQATLKKIGSSSSESKLDFAFLQSTCGTLNNLALNIRIEALSFQNIEVPAHAHIAHSSGSQGMSLTFQGDSEQLRHQGHLVFNCGTSSIALNIKKLKLSGHNIKVDSYGKIEHASLHFSKSAIQISSSNLLHLQVTAKGSAKGAYKAIPIDIDFDKIGVANSTPLSNLLSGALIVSAKNLHLRTPQNIFVGDISFAPQREETNIMLPYEFSGLNYKNSTGASVAEGVSSTGQCSLGETLYSCEGSVRDVTKTLAFSKMNVTYAPASSETSIRLAPKKSFLKLSAKTGKALPQIAKFLQDGNGQFELAGELTSTAAGWQGDLAITGKKINMTTGFGQLSDYSLNHNLLSYPSLKSSNARSLSIGEYNAGTILRNIAARYHVVSSERIEVESLSFNYEGAEIIAKAFTIFPKEKRVEHFRATVKNYELKKLLSMGLKDKVSATGTLSGTINVTFKGKVPILDGVLVADSPGTIQYRFGQLQKPLISMSDSPMDILYGYLYDFEFKTLSVDIKTNDTYKMDMLLSTYGHNANYLKGKPLKLKLNLEQNLLAAIRSMMLTYDLPNKIKEHLEKVDLE